MQAGDGDQLKGGGPHRKEQQHERYWEIVSWLDDMFMSSDETKDRPECQGKVIIERELLPAYTVGLDPELLAMLPKYYRGNVQNWADEVQSVYTVENLQLFDFVPGGEDVNLIATADGKDVCLAKKRWPIPCRPLPGAGAGPQNFYGPLSRWTNREYNGMTVE